MKFLLESSLEDAKKEFGTTTNWKKAAYINTDGTMLDFSYGSARRVEDHRSISFIYDDVDGTDAMIKYMLDGHIRFLPEGQGLDMIKEPTQEQYKTIKDLCYNLDELYVDFTNEKGYIVDSIEYNKVNPNKVVNDIKEYFKTGKIPQQSITQQFSESVKNKINRKILNETKYIELNYSIDDINDYINTHYRKTKDINSLKSTSHLINKEGYFIDLGDNTHIQILKDLVDNNIIRHKDSDLDKINLINTDLFTELGYIRCNSDIHEYTYIQLPKTQITSAQYETLRDWLDDIANKSDLVEGEIHIGLDVNIIDGPSKYYSYVPDVDYIINRIKRYYTSGNLYESKTRSDLDDLTGKQFGELTVLEHDKEKSKGKKDTYWKCRCSCGKITSVARKHLLDGSIKSCGHTKRQNGLDHTDNFNGMRDRQNKYNTNLEVIRNQKMQPNNTSGVKGVHYNKARGRWVAEVSVGGKNIRRDFKNKEDAIKYRQELVDTYYKPKIDSAIKAGDLKEDTSQKEYKDFEKKMQEDTLNKILTNFKRCQISDSPQGGSEYILFDGKFLSLGSLITHLQFEDYMERIYKISLSYLPSGIQVNDSEYEPIIRLSITKRPNTSEYYAIEEWLEHLYNSNRKTNILDLTLLKEPIANYDKKSINLLDYDKEDIIQIIKDYFRYGYIVENLKESNEEELSNEYDSEGNQLTNTQSEFFKNSKVRDSQGRLLVCYHGTTASFTSFEKGDVGFHFGTKTQAEDRIKDSDSSNKNVGAYYLNITNPLFGYDFGPWGPHTICHYWYSQSFENEYTMFEDIGMSKKELKKLLESAEKDFRNISDVECETLDKEHGYNSKLGRVLREIIKSRGYDGIVYENNFENNPERLHGAYSYIAFEPNQIKSITNKEPSNSSNINERLEPIDPEIEDNADSDVLVSKEPYDIRNYLINNFASKVSYFPEEDLYAVIDPYNLTHWDILPDLYKYGFRNKQDTNFTRWYFIPTDEIDDLQDGYLGEYDKENFRDFITYVYKTGYLICLEKDDYKGTSLQKVFGNPIKVDTLYNIVYNNINEELEREDSFDEIASAELKELNKFLDNYGFEAELITDYDFENNDAIGMFLNSEQDDASVFPIALNKKSIISTTEEIVKETPFANYDSELYLSIKSTLAHEVGHGIFEYLNDIYDLDEYDEEEIVEEFARDYCDGHLEYNNYRNELFDILNYFMKDFDDTMNEEINTIKLSEKQIEKLNNIIHKETDLIDVVSATLRNKNTLECNILDYTYDDAGESDIVEYYKHDFTQADWDMLFSNNINEDIWTKKTYKGTRWGGEPYEDTREIYAPEKDSKYQRLLRKPINQLTYEELEYLYVIYNCWYMDQVWHFDTYEDAYKRIITDEEDSNIKEYLKECYEFISKLEFPLTIYRAIRENEYKDGKFNISGKNSSRSWTTNLEIYTNDTSKFKHSGNIVSCKIDSNIVDNANTINNFIHYTSSKHEKTFGEYEITLKSNFKQSDLQDLHWVDKDGNGYYNKLNESLEQLPNGVITDSPYDILNLLTNKSKPYRILYDANIDKYMIGDAWDTIHLKLLEDAIKQGYYSDNQKVKDILNELVYMQGYTTRDLLLAVPNYFDTGTDGEYNVEPNIDPYLIVMFYLPNAEDNGEAIEDGYDKQYNGKTGTIYTRGSDLEGCELYKLWNNYNKKQK